jgi:hypothetical protein
MAAHDRVAAIAATLESDQMTTELEMKGAATTTQEIDFVELGEVSTDTKGGAGQNVLDGGAGWWF